MLLALITVAMTACNFHPSNQAQDPQPAFRALLVGVDHYSRANSNWSDLHGSTDVKTVQELLNKYWGKNEKVDIHCLADTQATKEAITKEFESWLIKDAKPSDRIFFFFSGHGTLVPAPDLATHVRSAILPYNAKSLPYDANKKGAALDPASLINGRYFKDALSELKKKNVTNVTLMFDACCSAAMSRGGDAISKKVDNIDVDPVQGQTAVPSVGLANDIDLGDFMVITAARADRPAFETIQGGNLTIAFEQAVHNFFDRQATAKVAEDMTYADLRDGIQAALASLPQPSTQEPGYNGSLDRTLFDTKKVIADPYYLVTAKKDVVVAAGSIFGITVNMRFAIYPPNTRKTTEAKPIAIGTVSQVGPYDCVVKISEYSGKPEDLNEARARLIDATPDASIEVDMTALDVSPKYHPITEFALDGTLFHKVANGQPYVAKVIPPGTKLDGFQSMESEWIVADAAGHVVNQIDASSTNADIATQIQATLRLIARRNAILKVRADDPEVKVEMEVVPAKLSNQIVTDLSPGDKKNPAPLAYGDNEDFAIRVRATDRHGNATKGKSVYLVVLDCLPNAHVQALWPRSATASENTRLIADGNWRYLSRYGSLVEEVNKADIAAWRLDDKDGQGQEVFKLFASDVSGIEYTPLLSQTRGAGRGVDSSVGKLLTAFRDGQPVARTGGDDVESSKFSVAQLSLTYRSSKQ
jgi:hypothetical protein